MRFVRYLGVQVLAYVLDMGSFLLFYGLLNVDPILANWLGKIMAGLFAFFAHRHFTFDVTGPAQRGQQALRYFALLILNIPLAALLLTAWLWFFSQAVVAKFLADAVGVLLTYWVSKNHVFSARAKVLISTDRNRNPP